MDNKHNEIKLLTEKYLKGCLADSEYAELANLLKDQANTSYFNQLKYSWDPKTQADQRSTTNWTRLARKINYKSENITQSKPFVIGQNWLLRIAAILVIGLLISTSLLYLKNQNYTSGITTIETPRGEKSKVYLPDGSEVWLNASSKITFNSFTKRSRFVKLEGEAYFKIKHNEKAPFTVQTNECVIKDLGTEFNVMAYNQLNREEVTLFKGSAEVKTNTGSTLLKVGDKVLIADNKIQEQKANLEQTHGWVENKFYFIKVPLDELILRLENWYDVDIECNKCKKGDIVFTGSFKNEETIWEVLEAINVYIPITYEKLDVRKIKLNVN